MKRFLSLFLLCSIVLSSAVLANFTEDALREPMGVRASGLGGAFTGIADDSSALFYNPAGLAEPGTQYASGMMDNSRSQLNLSAYSVMNIGPLTYGERRIATLKNEFANIYSYAFAQRGMNGINWGLSYKKIMEESDERNSDEGWAADLGVLIKLTPEASVGVLAQNISAGGDLDIVPNYRLGGSLRWAETLWAVDAEYQDISPHRAPNTVMHYGLEKEILSGFAVRFGSDDTVGTMGFSLGLPFAIFEYATRATDPYTYRFGFKLGQDKLQGEKDRTFALFKEKDFVEMDIGGDLIAGQSSFSLFGGVQHGADVLREQIRLARTDDQVGGIILHISSLDTNLGMFGTIQELRQELQRFKKDGKKIIAYLGADGDYASYYLASVADKIVMPQGGSVGMFGVVLSPWFLGKLFDNIGVQWQTVYAGKYKTGLHETNEVLPTASRELLVRYITEVNDQVMADIATARNLPTETVTELRTGKFMIAKRAKDLKLIDEIGHYEQAKDMVKEVAGNNREPDIIKADVLRPMSSSSYFSLWPKKVAIIDIDGVIVLGHGVRDVLFGSKTVAADDICEELDKVAEDDRIKVIILRINSPGGAAIAADQIYEKVLQIKEKSKKIVIASCGNIAASGGYYIACAADKIIANPATILGSIGVYQEFPLYYGLLQKLDIRTETLKTGESADMLSGLRPLSETEKALLQGSVDAIHEQFMMVVARGRRIDLEKVRPLAQGQIFTGVQAKSNGLIDSLGNFTKALDLAKEMADIKGDVELVRYVRNESFWDQVGYRVGTFLGFDKQIAMYMRRPLTQYRLY